MNDPLRMPDQEPRGELAFTFAGRTVRARAGETIAMALWADHTLALRASSADGAPRGVFCNMGICYECLVRVDGVLQRACTTLVEPGMQLAPGGPPP
jgi:predicted molibdopterin-dependent oxidoreductase YjgC